MATPGEVVKGYATRSEQKHFISMVSRIFQKYATKHRFNLCSFAIAQACYEGGWGFSYDAVHRKNILGIGPHKSFSSWDECVSYYFTSTVLGRSSLAASATTLDQFYKAFVESGYLGGSGQSSYFEAIKSIISSNNLSSYDRKSQSNQINKLDEFMNETEKHLGESYSDWVRGMLRKSGYEPWCADFIWACAKKVGIEGEVISGSAGAHMLISQTAENCGGVIHDGSSSYTPTKGDLVNFVWHGGGFADHIGVVRSCEGGTVYTIEGNTSNTVAHREYRRSSPCLLRFCTPDWSKVGGGSSNGGLVLGSLYDYHNTRKDAIAREVAYLNKSLTPKVKYDDITISIINYTDLFQAFWDAGASLIGGSSASGEYDYSKLDSNVQAVVKYLVSKGLHNAAACGICGNIYYESSFNTATIGDNGTSFGICQWHLGRGAAMKRTAGENWKNNLTGQLDYLWYELESSYNSSVLDPLKSVPNSDSGARHAADVFVRKFEIPANVDYQSSKRQAKASEYFNKITQVIKSNGGDFSSTDLRNVSDKRRKIVEAARSQLGVPYVWAGETPGKALDCSGLTQYCYRQVGISLTHYTGSQYNEADERNPISKAVIGDILYKRGHVGIFIGDNKYIHEPKPGDKCKESSGIDLFTHALHWNI